MTESPAKEFDMLAGNTKVAEAVSSSDSAVRELEVVNVVVSGRNDIKVSAEGVAKLTFGFLDDMQGGDSSLEPGEVKTPPPGSSPATIKESTPSRLAQQRPEPPVKQLAKETLAKALKTVSQLEAEACEEKVRAILELDAKRRKEETEKRKLEAEKRRQSGETDMELESKRKAKEERKKIKKIKKAKKAAEKALTSFEEDNQEESPRKKRKSKAPIESEESEGLCSSGPDDKETSVTTSDKHISVLNSAIAVPSVPTLRYPQHLPPHLLPGAFMGGFRPMNPFMRGPRPDFSHGRGGFMPRGRGGMRGRMPFQGFRPPFFSNNAAGEGHLKFNAPHGAHGLHCLQQQRLHHTPPPNRGHSPILPPNTDLQWTKCKPSISYAFKFNKEHKFQGINLDVKTLNQERSQLDDNWDDENPEAYDAVNQEDYQKRRQTRKKDKKRKSLQKDKKKSKKQSEKCVKKLKRTKISVRSSTSSLKQKKKSSKSSRKKIEKIRKSYGSSSRTTPTLHQQHSSEDTETNENPQDEEVNQQEHATEKQNDEEDMPDEAEIRNKVENIKTEKIETTQLKIVDLSLKVKPFIIIKTEPSEKEEEKKESQKITTTDVAGKAFDIFAETSPTPAPSTPAIKYISPDKDEDELVSVTPPLPTINDPKGQKLSSLQNALEIQKRIDKLLQQDDIKFEAIEAAKDLLIKKTQKYQSSKEKLTPERDTNKATEQKQVEKAKTTTTSHKEESSFLKEKPKAYKDKESNKKTKESDKESQKYRNSKLSEDEDSELKVRSSSTTSKDKSKDLSKDDRKSKNNEKDRDKYQKSDNEKEKEKSRKSITAAPTYRNPFKRSLSRDRFFNKIDFRRRSRTKSRERDFSKKRRQSNDRKRADSSGYSSSRISTKRRFSGSSGASTQFNRSKSGERDIKGSLDSLISNEKDRRNRKREKTPESKYKRKRSATPKSKREKTKEILTKSEQTEKAQTNDSKSNTPPPKLNKIDDSIHDKSKLKEHTKTKSPIKAAPKKRPLSFTQTEFLFPEEGKIDDFILADDEETNDSFKNLKSCSDKEDSPDTDDYMDNWENDEDVDIDINSNMPTDISTPRKSSPDLIEENSFVTRFANPSPPKELLEKDDGRENNDGPDDDTQQPLTPPLDLLKNLPLLSESMGIQKDVKSQCNQIQENKKTDLFGMQELYDQFIKSVEASGVSMKTANKDQAKKCEEGTPDKSETSNSTSTNNEGQSEDPLSTSSNSTSSSTSSSSSSSTDSNSSSNSSSSSSSESSSEDSNDVTEFKKTVKVPTKKLKIEQSMSPKISVIDEKILDDSDVAVKTPVNQRDEIVDREPRTPSPSPLQKSLLLNQTPPTNASQNKVTPKSDVAKDFKKLKNLEANLSRIQMMRANYDSNDEISEELHKMEMLFLQEKKIILQKYAKNTPTAEKPTETKSDIKTSEFVLALPATEFGIVTPPLPPEEPNKIFDANREAIKLTISPLKLPSKPAIFNVSLTEETEKKIADDKEEMDFTEKLVKPVKEVAIVKPMMESKESKDSRTKDSHRHRRSPVYGGSRERQRSPNNFRDRNRRSNSRNRFSSPQRRGRGRSLSASPPRRGMGIRHGTPPRRGAPGGRFRATNRRSRSRSRSPFRQFGNRRGKEGSPFRRKRGPQQDFQTHYKKFGRQRSSRSRSPRSPHSRPRSPRTPPPRRRSYSQDPYSRSPLPFKPPSPPMRRSMSPMGSPNSPARRSRSPPRRPKSPRSPRSPISPRSPHSPRSPRSPPPNRYDDHRYRRENSFERHSSSSPHPQYYTPGSLAAGTSSQSPSYYYNVSPNRISLDARINIVLNTPGGGAETPPPGYEGYTNYAQYGGAAYMPVPPQPMADPANNMGYYGNPYVPMVPSTHEGHHSILPHHSHGIQHPLHQPALPPHMQPQQHAPAYSNIPTINSVIPASSSPVPQNNFYYNDFNVGHQPSNPVLKEIPKAPVAVQKGNVLEILPSNPESAQSPQIDNKEKSSPVLVETIKNHIDKIASISWKDEVNNRHVKSAVMRLNRGGDNAMRSILKCSESAEKSEKIEKKKVYFEDGIYPSRDSDDEDRKLIEYKIRKKVLRLRKKRGIDVPAARDLVDLNVKLQKPKKIAALEKLPPPPPPTTMVATNLEQPIYLRPPTPVPLVYFHFDSVVPSMYVSQLEKPIPPRLLNPKCVPPGVVPASIASGNVAAGGSTNAAPNHSPNLNLSSGGPTTKKELTTMAALNRVNRNENIMNSPKSIGDAKQESPNSQMPIGKPSGMHFTPTQTSPQMSPLHGPVIRHPPSPIGFVGMRINNFMRLPPSPLARTSVPPHMQAPPPNMVNLPPMMMGMRHPQYNMPPPNIMPPGMPPDANYNPVPGSTPYGVIQTPPPAFQGYGQRPINPGFFMGPVPPHAMHPPPPIPALNAHAKGKDHMLHHQQHHHLHQQHHHPPQPQPHPHHHPQQHHHHQQQQHHHHQHKPPPPLPSPIAGGAAAASPQAMIAPFNVKKTVN